MDDSNIAAPKEHSPATSGDMEPGASTEQRTDSLAVTTPAAPSSLEDSLSTGGLPFGLLTSVGNINLSSTADSAEGFAGSGGRSGSKSSAADLSLDFNVDALNLENLAGLSGLDFDMANIFSQVSSASLGGFSGASSASAPLTASVVSETDKEPAAPLTASPERQGRSPVAASQAVVAQQAALEPAAAPVALGSGQASDSASASLAAAQPRSRMTAGSVTSAAALTAQAQSGPAQLAHPAARTHWRLVQRAPYPAQAPAQVQARQHPPGRPVADQQMHCGQPLCGQDSQARRAHGPDPWLRQRLLLLRVLRDPEPDRLLDPGP
ncbi:hypothetical protein GGI04_005188 [Coemansia thaxteri]|nr:hypothetical protein GGI04_005188 [Coemansia thaxteri]KAJ2465849.1 hypothetical protein GGI02_004567 [Coemansia sp. RSA 2322]